MKKNALLFSLFLLFVFATLGFAQTYEARLVNDILVNANTYEYDIYVLRTGGTAFEAYGLQHCLLFDNAVLNGGTASIIYIPGTSQMNALQEPTNAVNTTALVGDKRVVKMAAKAASGGQPGSIISNIAPGTRFGRFRLTTTASSFAALQANFQFNFNQATYGYATKYQAVVGGFPVEITTAGTHINELVNGVLPVELNSFTAISQGRDVELSWETKTEVNTNMFQVERALQSTQNWTKIADVTASGNSNSEKSYSFTDAKLQSGKYIYRLKMIDNDGTYDYSKLVETEVSLPKDYAVSQNYPNPFNPTTRIDYQLPFDSRVTLELYGITGEKVATILSGDQIAGYYTADVNAGAYNLASGVYIYRMTANNQTGQNFVQVKKLMLTK